ncbi:hypothetical protein BJ742DRAFT_834852 [Cladochytrium replicatum]|nr:hypothetical protein BJ742DRAFT_834852 [Cladochytrium replicatum]
MPTLLLSLPTHSPLRYCVLALSLSRSAIRGFHPNVDELIKKNKAANRMKKAPIKPGTKTGDAKAQSTTSKRLMRPSQKKSFKKPAGVAPAAGPTNNSAKPNNAAGRQRKVIPAHKKRPVQLSISIVNERAKQNQKRSYNSGPAVSAAQPAPALPPVAALPAGNSLSSRFAQLQQQMTAAGLAQNQFRKYQNH